MYTEIKRLLTKKFVGAALDMTFILTEDKSADARRRGKTVLIAGKIFSRCVSDNVLAAKDSCCWLFATNA